MKTPSVPLSIYIAIIILLQSVGAYGAEPWLAFKHINSENGLSHNTVPSIAQDSAGYVWLATHDGLNRNYNHRTKVYRHVAGDSTSLPSDEVVRVTSDPRGRLWVLTPGAVSLYSRERDNFSNYMLPSGIDAKDMLPVGDDEIMVGGTGGVYSFSPSSGAVRRVGMGTAFDGASVLSLGRAGSVIYIGTRRGAWQADVTARRAVRIESDSRAQVNQIYTSPAGEVWIGTEGDGILRRRPGDNRFERVSSFGDAKIDTRYVRAFSHDRDGRIWIGTFKGLYVGNPADSTMFHVPSISDKDGGDISERLNQASILCVFMDSQGGMWVGTHHGGVDYSHPQRNQFRSMRRDSGLRRLNDNTVTCMKEADNGEILIGTGSGGVNIYNPRTNTYRHLTKADGLATNDILAVRARKAYPDLVIGMNHGGLAVADLGSLRILRTILPGADVYDMRTAVDRHSLWVCTPDGLYYADPVTGATRRVVTDDTGAPIPSVDLTDLYGDKSSRLWISGKKGLSVYSERPGGVLKRITLLDKFPRVASAHVNAVGESPTRGEIFVSTRDGLYIISPDFSEARLLTTADGLPNNIVYGVLEDRNGDLWVSTNHGISHIDRATGETRNYSGADYLPFNQFNPKSYVRTKDGRIYFGGVRGIISFDPANISANPFSPVPQIVGLRIFDKPVQPGDGSGVLGTTIETADAVTLGPEQSMVGFDFAVCNYADGRHARFAYRLAGYDPDWFETGSYSSADYRNLPPGDYTFQLKAANSDGVWSDVRELRVKVLPRWYQLWWVRALGMVALAAIIFVVVRAFTRRKLARERLEYERRDIERRQEVNDMKVNFFVNMSHELRTPLTLILMPVTELLEQKRSEPRVVDKLETIRANTLRILDIINQILDYQRAENGMFGLNVSPQDINSLIRREYDMYRQAATYHNIDFRLESTVGDTPVSVDPSYISIIAGNLLSNSFKHTPDGRSITVSLSLSDDGRDLVIRVSDTGEGIAADKLPHIFDRFYKATETGYGSGIGLSLVHRLVELHHGTITVESTPGEGTCFTVTLPARAEDYAPEETHNDSAEHPMSHTAMLDGAEYVVDDDGETPAASDDSSGEKPRILVVDDNPGILKYMSEALAPTYQVLKATGGAEALEIMENESVDMVITDVMMPGVDGVQLCRSIKRNLRTSHIPVVMLSAKSEVRDQLEALKVGADDYLPKPFSMPLLLGKIANRLRTRARAISYYTSSTTALEPAKMALNPLDEEFLTNAVKVVEQHMDDSEFTTDRFAREMLVSRTNLHMKLKALTGESANEFIRRQRMNRALELLRSGRHTVAEVSAMVGYGTPSYFSTSFKKFFGELPSDYIH